MNRIILILDLDGVLITTSPWKADEMDSDGYSVFNVECVQNLNSLLELAKFDIWLSSTRRTVKTLQEFNAIFEHRQIKQSIEGFLPEYTNCNSRKDEVIEFLNEKNPSNYLIIDDDKSLNDLNTIMKTNLISTDLVIGFNNQKFELARQWIKAEHNIT